MAQRDFMPDVVDMRQSDAEDTVELIIRCAIILACGTTLYYSTGLPFMLVWCIAYVPMIWLYVLHLRRARGPYPRRKFIVLFAANVFIALWFASMCVYVVSLGTPAYFFIGGCGVCGLALHNIVRHHRFTYIAISDMVTIVLLVAAVIVLYVREHQSLPGDLAILTAGLSIAGYYTHSFIILIRMRQKLARRIGDEAQGQKMQAVGQLTSGVAHDFNNILTVIQGNLELHDVVEDPAEKRALLRDARVSSQKAAHLVAQLLAFSRKAHIAPQGLVLSDELAQFEAMAVRVLPANVRIEIAQITPELTLYVDPTLLQTALLNIATNARDAMRSEGGVLTVTASRIRRRPDLGAPALTEIALTDSGPGVPEADLPRLIEPFYTSKAVGEGSGLGLSMVQGFVAQSGGTLVIENARDAGLCVRLRLPESAPTPQPMPQDAPDPAREVQM